jgi:hypothetical protein
MPAWIASRGDGNGALKQGQRGTTSDRSRHRIRHGLIVAELALTLTLLTGAGYFVRGIQKLTHRSLGWRPENVLIGDFAMSHDRYGEHGDKRSLVFGDRFLALLRQLPGVDGAEISSMGNPVWGGAREAVSIEGRAAPPRGQEPQVYDYRVSAGFFETFGIRLLRGRYLSETDRPGSQNVAVINQAIPSTGLLESQCRGTAQNQEKIPDRSARYEFQVFFPISSDWSQRSTWSVEISPSVTGPTNSPKRRPTSL